MTKASLKGYLLEELLAYLIRNTGYKLLVDPRQDTKELARRGHGLEVKGRGSYHQVDVLGQLGWIPAFTFPIRLFVEAKCRSKTTGIPVVRAMIGMLADINQNYSPIQASRGKKKILSKRYTYCGAIFSTSGFSEYATDLAVAHHVSLIDLSGPDFHDLRSLLDDLTDSIFDNLPVDTPREDTSLENEEPRPSFILLGVPPKAQFARCHKLNGRDCPSLFGVDRW